MSVTIFFEGGGDTEATQSRHRKGLSDYCSKLNPGLRRPRIVASGGREQAFDKFKMALAGAHPGEIYVLLVDSESPIKFSTAQDHLHVVDGWNIPLLGEHQIFLMVQCMESWLLADRRALAEFYDGGFQPKSLPGSEKDIEAIPKGDVGSGLKRATAKTKTKGEYQKILHGSVLLALIDPQKVEIGSPHAKQFHDFLRSL